MFQLENGRASPRERIAKEAMQAANKFVGRCPTQREKLSKTTRSLRDVPVRKPGSEPGRCKAYEGAERPPCAAGRRGPLGKSLLASRETKHALPPRLAVAFLHSTQRHEDLRPHETRTKPFLAALNARVKNETTSRQVDDGATGTGQRPRKIDGRKGPGWSSGALG